MNTAANVAIFPDLPNRGETVVQLSSTGVADVIRENPLYRESKQFHRNVCAGLGVGQVFKYANMLARPVERGTSHIPIHFQAS